MSKAIKLAKKGKTIVAITVTAQDGLKKTCRVTVTKKPKPAYSVRSNKVLFSTS